MPDTVAPVLDLEALTAAVEMLEKATIAFEEGPKDATREEMVATCDGLRDLVKRVQMCDASLVQIAAKRWKIGEIVVAPGVVAEKKWDSQRKQWQHDAIRPVIVEKIIQSHVDHETGALDAPTSQLMMEAINACTVGGYKTTVLKPLGIDVDKYCTKGDGKANLVLRKSGRPKTPGKDEEDGE